MAPGWEAAEKPALVSAFREMPLGQAAQRLLVTLGGQSQFRKG